MILKIVEWLLALFITAGLMAMYYIAFFFDSLDGIF